ncbi:MAG: ATP-binding protein [Bacteroidetes bacterium]|nr:ATP-binding protein [Bacteroidota bacterium]MBX7046454.1 ATP-binding protein [Ignavibacteria bacterium]
MKNYSLELPSSRNEISKFENLLIEINNEFGMTMEKFINFQIASSEAIVNAIVHGNKQNPDKKVKVDIVTNDHRLELTIKDEGEGFDVNRLPDPTDESNLYKESGRGVYIIRSLVDEFTIQSNSSGTTMKLIMNK